jgi:glycosyltransferase involved in cell wall biosynthesis
VTTPLLIVQVAEFAADGHAEYRVHGPGRGMARQDGVTVVDCDPLHRHLPLLLDLADVVIFHGFDPDYPPIARRRRESGLLTVAEASDLYTDVHPWSGYSVAWLDRGTRDQFHYLLGQVDLVQTSTGPLAEVWAKTARAVAVFPNGLESVPPLADPPDRPLTVGWAGSSTHLADWFSVAPHLQRWVAARSGTRLAVMTDPRGVDFVSLPPDRFIFRPPGTFTEYCDFLNGVDIGVVPLLPTPFNRGRTDVKFLEFASCGVVGVFADSAPYLDSIRSGETGFLFATGEELTSHLSQLADDAELRSRVRSAAYREAQARSQVDGVSVRLDEYRRRLPAREDRGTALPEAAVRDSTADGRYLQLRPGRPEAAVRRGREVGDDGALAELDDVVREFPAYPAAARTLGRLLNDRNRFLGAAKSLEAGMPPRRDVPTHLIELARSRVGLGEVETAQLLLERAAALNPTHSGVWPPLIRLATDPTAAARWADRAAHNRPSDFLAALAAARAAPTTELAPRLRDWLTVHGPGLHPEERPYAAAAFAGILPGLTDDDSADVWDKAEKVFPDSAKIADLYARWLYARGRVPAAADRFSRVDRMRRAADGFRLEFPSEPDPTAWQVATYAKGGGL